MRRNLHGERGNIAIFTAVMIILSLFLLTSLFQASLAAFSSSLAWDIRRQRDIEARAVAGAVKEAILSVAETAPTVTSESLATAISMRAAAVTNGSPTVAIASDAANAAVSLPANPQWPAATPVAAATPNFSGGSELAGIGRNLQWLLSAGRIADLGTRTFSFTQSNTTLPGETGNYVVTARLFSVPVGNFTWIAYGQPSAVGGVISGVPPSPSFSRSAGFTAPLATAYAAEAGSFPDLFGGIGSTLPYYYRDLVSLTWNTFEYWTGLSYQNDLLAAAGTAGTFDFSNPAHLPDGLTWNGTEATLDLGATAEPVVVVIDSVGGNRLRLVGSASSGTPVVVVVRNFSPDQTVVEIVGNNSRTALLYVPNSTLTPSTAGLSIRGAVLLFPNSSVSAAFSVSGLVAYPQSFLSAPSIQAVPDAQARVDLESVTPRALLVSTRASQP
jgi:hypothetical protein